MTPFMDDPIFKTKLISISALKVKEIIDDRFRIEKNKLKVGFSLFFLPKVFLLSMTCFQAKVLLNYI